jgi:urease accessory protein
MRPGRTTTTTGIAIPTAIDGTLRLRVGPGGVLESRGHAPLAARAVHAPDGWTRVVLVQTTAGPLAGDRIELHVEVDAGARLELTASAATLAYPATEGAKIAVRCRVGEGGRLAWLGQPLILAAGCELAASLDVEIESGAAAVLRETIVLGRHGETAGRYRGSIRCDLAGRPLLRDTVAVDGADKTAAPVALGGARAFSTLAALGVRPADEPAPGELDLHGVGRLLRLLSAGAAALAAPLEQAERRYLEAL